MGSISEFICSKCSLHLEVCGGYSVGEAASCQTYHCKDCDWVFDHFTGHDFSDPQRHPFANDHGIEGEGVPCPKCRGKNTKFWDPECLCPNCGTPMKPGGMAILWD